MHMHTNTEGHCDFFIDITSIFGQATQFLSFVINATSDKEVHSSFLLFLISGINRVPSKILLNHYLF